MAQWVVVQGQVKVAKKSKNTPTCSGPPSEPQTEKENLFKQESESKTLKCFGVGAESEYIQPKQERSRSEKFQTLYTSASCIDWRVMAEIVGDYFSHNSPVFSTGELWLK